FVAAGVDVMLIGPLPTPGIAYMTRRFNCDFGVVISASHNLYDDNGIKFFDASGAKLSDELEERIELELEQPPTTRASRNLARHARRPFAYPIPGVLRLDAADRGGPVRPQDRHRLRQRRRLQSGAARPRRPGRGDR